MNIAPYDIAYLISSLFNLYIIKRFMDVFFKLKRNGSLKALAAYCTYFVATGILHFYLKIPGIMLIANLILLFLIACCYDANIKKRLLAAIYVYFVGFSSEVIVTAFTMTELTPFKEYEYSNIAGFFASKILNFFIVLLIGNASSVKQHQAMPFWLFLSSTIIPILTLFVQVLLHTTAGVSPNTILISITALFITNVVVFFLYDSLAAAYDKQLKTAIAEQERTYYYHQCLLMQESAEDVRNFKHDMNNHLFLLQKFMNDGKVEEVKTYINELVREHQKLKTLYSATGNVAIDSILNYKLGNVSNANIHVDVQANVPTELAVEIVDLSIILTNLLDNALTAITKAVGERLLSIRISYQKGMLLIHVSNSYNGNVRYENGELVTTKEEKTEHGRGLYNIRKAAEKYHGVLRLKHDANTFTAEVILYAA